VPQPCSSFAAGGRGVEHSTVPARPVHREAYLPSSERRSVRQGELCWFSAGFFHEAWRGGGERSAGTRTEGSGMPSALRGGCGPMHGSPYVVDSLSSLSRRMAPGNRPPPGRRHSRRYLMSALSGAGGWILGAAKVMAVPYLAFLALLYTTQRAIIFQSPQSAADPTATGGDLVMLPACRALMQCADLHAGAAAELPKVIAVHFPAKSPDLPTLVYFHGNADQIGWGAAYLGKTLSDAYGESLAVFRLLVNLVKP
jgi:hypothetical protein